MRTETATAPVTAPLDGTAPLLLLDRVERRFARRRVLGPLSLTMEPGSVCVLTGPNGSGKTTLLRLAAGLLVPTVGTRVAAGSAVYLIAGGGARAVQDCAAALWWTWQAGGREGYPPAAALAAVDLAPLAHARAGSLSSGERARLSLALALTSGAGLVCLDEPTSHLDDAGVAAAITAVSMLGRAGAAVLVATHDDEAFAGVADAVLRLRAGTPENRA